MMATRRDATRAFRARLEREAREAEGLRETAEELNRRIWAAAKTTEDHLRRLRRRWWGETAEGGERDDAG